MPSATSTPRPGRLLPDHGLSRASRARMPPSPRLSARITSSRYFSETTTTSDQKISDRMPNTRSGVGRSEEHTSELQSLMRNSYAVFCLKKKKHYADHVTTHLHPCHNSTTSTQPLNDPP